jgi:hypothetical protein
LSRVDATECGFCGKPLLKRSGPGRPRKFCGDLCRGRAKSARIARELARTRLESYRHLVGGR